MLRSSLRALIIPLFAPALLTGCVQLSDAGSGLEASVPPDMFAIGADFSVSPNGRDLGRPSLADLDFLHEVDFSVARTDDLSMPGADLAQPPDLAVTIPDLTSNPDYTLPPDLSIAPDLTVPIDLSVPIDLTTLPDLVTPPDLLPPPDLTPLPGCRAPGGTCEDYDICTNDICNVDGTCSYTNVGGPCAWAGSFVNASQNPLLVATTTSSLQGADNVYAPSILRLNSTWWMWYGAQGSDGHDRIFLARTSNLAWWEKFPSWLDPVPSLGRGTSNHVNDPSVVFVNNQFRMYYTDAATGENDRIGLAMSGDGQQFTKAGIVLDVGPFGDWDSYKVGRPSVLYEEGEYRMWYDGQAPNAGRHVGYATSTDGVHFKRSPMNPIILNSGAVDVQHIGDWYVLLDEGGDGIHLWVGKDPTHFQSRGLLVPKSGKAYDAFGKVTPHLVTDGTNPIAIFFGGASNACWCKNRIAAAFYQADPASCNSCLGGTASCQAACEGLGLSTGVCGAPGSTNPAACCSCTTDPCSKCIVGGATNCQKACKRIGKTTGYCGFPGSTNTSQCCICF